MRPYKILVLASLSLPLFLVSCATFQGHGSFEKAQRSYAARNYSRAFTELWDPVQYRDPRAMYAMGYMYYYGIGTNKDEDIALSLIRAAAKQGCPSAVIALRMLSASKATQYAPMEKSDAYQPRGTIA